jgi:hypothetical protein
MAADPGKGAWKAPLRCFRGGADGRAAKDSGGPGYNQPYVAAEWAVKRDTAKLG